MNEYQAQLGAELDAENAEIERIEAVQNIRYQGLARYLPDYLKFLISQRLKQGKKV